MCWIKWSKWFRCFFFPIITADVWVTGFSFYMSASKCTALLKAFISLTETNWHDKSLSKQLQIHRGTFGTYITTSKLLRASSELLAEPRLLEKQHICCCNVNMCCPSCLSVLALRVKKHVVKHLCFLLSYVKYTNNQHSKLALCWTVWSWTVTHWDRCACWALPL